MKSKSNEKLWKVLIHIVIWMLIFVLPGYVLFMNSGYDTILFKHAAFHTISFALLFYLNYFWLSGWFFRRQTRWLAILLALFFVGALVLTFDQTMAFHGPRRKPPGEMKAHVKEHWAHRPDGLTSDSILSPIHHRHIPPKHPSHPRGGSFKNIPVFNFFIFSMLFSVLGLGLKYTERMAGMEKRRKEAEKERIRAELAYLKMQISPHFFFNTLNNIYALIDASPSDGQHAVLQLSRLMRYMIYESERGNVLLHQEVDFIRNYLELMRLRLTPNTKVEVRLQDNLPQKWIPPLLFLPFVENAFKHGVSNSKPSEISIRLQADGEHIEFECSNTIHQFAVDSSTVYPDYGIGLDNVRKRLHLLLAGRHQLQISEHDKQFVVNLKIWNIETDAHEDHRSG